MKGKWGILFLGFLGGAGLGVYTTVRYADKAIIEQGKSLERTKLYYEVLNEWMKVNHQGKTIKNYFVENGYHSVAIYGYAELGKRLYEELRASDKVEVKYLIDQNADTLCEDIAAYRPDEELPYVDVIVVTPVFAFLEIEKKLADKVSCPVVSLNDVLWDA